MLPLYISAFSFGLNLLYIIWLNVINSFKEFNSYYAVLIYNYNIFLGIAFAPLELFKCMCEKCQDLEEEAKIFLTFLIQFFIIGVFVSIGIVTDLNKIFNYYDNHVGFGWTFAVAVVFSFFLSLSLVLAAEGLAQSPCYFFFIIIYVPIIILFFFCFSSFTSDESIISFILVTFFKLLSIFISLICCDYKHFMIIFLISLISDGITIPLQFLLFPKILKSGWLGILVISGVIDIYITAISGYFLKKSIIHN